MRKMVLVAIALTGIISNGAVAQETVKKSVKKEVKVKVKNGVKTVIIKTKDGKKTTKEKYVGAAAEKKIAEMEAASGGKDLKKVEVKMKDVNGERRLTITTTENGETKEEVFEGKAADAKMKELDSSRKIEKNTKIIKVEKKVIKKSVN